GCGHAAESDLSRTTDLNTNLHERSECKRDSAQPSINMDIAAEQKINEDRLRPLKRTSIGFFLLVGFLGSIILAGFGAWIYQMWNGIAVAGIRWPIFWAFYITNFVFWIGISHAGTLISAILRLVNATWRRPVTRCAEVITVFALMIGAMFPIIHLGRPWLF